MTENFLLSIRPDYELVTRYAAIWQTQILDSANSAGLPYVDLYGEEATGANFFSNIETNDPMIVNILGHGDYNLIATQNHEIYLQGGVNTNVLANRIVFDLSCRAGRDLASASVNEGCISFLGYDEDFWICYSDGEHPDGGMLDPLADEVARDFLEPHNIAPITFINGGTTSDSYNASQASFNYRISVWEQIDSGIAALIMWNRDHQVLKGEGAEVVSVTVPKLGPLILAFAPLLIIPALKKK